MISPISKKVILSNLDREEKVDLINSELETLTAHFKNKARRAKTNFIFYKYASILLGTATTVISALQFIYRLSVPGWLLPLSSAGATITIAVLNISNSQRVWINSKTVAQKLHAEKFLFNQQAGVYRNNPEEENLRLFAERMIKIWDEGHGRWEQMAGG